MATAAEKPKKPREKKVVMVAKTPTDLQRMKLEKLMEHPEKPVVLPDPPKEKILPPPPEFNRNVMGSSAGAGSGEFHVYRHIRRREYARQKYIGEKADKEIKDVEFHQRIEENRKKAEEKTAKKRAKRLKKKQNLKRKKETQKGPRENSVQESGSGKEGDDDSSEESQEEDKSSD